MSQHSATFSASVPQTQPNAAFWKTLWRADALFNMVLGDIFLFAAGSVVDFAGMADGAITPLRVLGLALGLYGLLQLWIGRNGEVPRWAYQLASVDMDLTGIMLIGVLVAGVDFNGTGTAIAVVLAVASFIMAALWFVRSRQLA